MSGNWTWAGLTSSVVLALCASLTCSSTAIADVGAFEVRPETIAPGEDFELSFGAAWSERFPVSIIPVAQAPTPDYCGNGICTPIAPRPPRGDPFVPLGRVGPDPRSHAPQYDYRLRARLPELDPGYYAFVVYCEGCFEGPGGSMIASAFPGKGADRVVLRVRSRDAGTESSGTGSSGLWWAIATCSGLLAAGVVAFRRLRGSAGPASGA